MTSYKLSHRLLLAAALLVGASGIGYMGSKLWREITQSEANALDIKLPSLAPIVERSQKAVVVIRTESVIEHQPMAFPGLPFFVPVQPERQRGQGSGFFINEEGFILTNEHVIADAQMIEVTADAGVFKAKVVGADKALDIALLKIELDKDDKEHKNNWPYLPLGDSDKVRLGDWVLALGSPLGLVQSVNVGIIAQKHRGGIKPSGRELFVELMQLQMPINPGNSGGPIVDTAGRVVAVCESILASGQSIGFGVPINIVKDVIEQLRTQGKIIKAFLGVEPDDLKPHVAKTLGLPQNTKGAVIVEVLLDKPAHKGGLKAGDVVLEIDGKVVTDAFSLRQHTAYKPVGTEVTLKIYRKGEGNITKKVKLEMREGEKEERSTQPKVEPASTDLTMIDTGGFNISVRDTPLQSKKELGLKNEVSGAEVVEVNKKSTYRLVDLVKGDVIIKVDNTPIRSAKQLKDLFDKASKNTTMLMIIHRGKSPRFVSITKE